MANEVEEKEAEQKGKPGVSRRDFLKKTGYLVGGVVIGGVAGGVLGRQTGQAPRQAPAPGPSQPQAAPDYNQALMYFTPAQFAIVEAAAERIFPADENGPGAKELGAAYYIDHQLAGDWGFNGREYMMGPFFKGEKTQGYQGRLKRREIFDIALQEMQNYSMSKYQKKFTELSADQQDQVLQDFADDKVPINTISPSGFFAMLRSSTIEGVYADPLYGGNKNMGGWKMKNYPGAQMAYTQVIESKEFVKMPPVSLRDHQQ